MSELVTAVTGIFGGSAAAGVSSAAAIAVATINTAAQIRIAGMQYEIAKGYYDMARELRDFWNTSYKPVEQAELAEAMARPVYQPRYALTAGRFAASVRMQFRHAFSEAVRRSDTYCTGLTANLLKDLEIARALAVGDAINLGYRYEEARKEYKDEKRWGDRHNAVALGRNLLGQSQGYGSTAAQLLNGLGQGLQGATSGALQSLGRASVPSLSPSTLTAGRVAAANALPGDALDNFLALNGNFGTASGAASALGETGVAEAAGAGIVEAAGAWVADAAVTDAALEAAPFLLAAL